ncbi:MAG: glycosyltransferase, partial [Acidobacteriota bacterium]|nr:glycosyltransferase [Acidobacteriota bacterium]
MSPNHDEEVSVPDRSSQPPSSPDAGRLGFSVVVPVYNEEACVEPLYREIVAGAEATGRSFEIVLVDDGSSDETFATARRLAQTDSRLRVVR